MSISLTALSAAELTDLISAATAELASRPVAAPVVAPTPVQIMARINWASYNSRRYSKPYIAKVTGWTGGGRAELAWGSYLGNDQGGALEMSVNVADVIFYGQKDNRGSGSAGKYAAVAADGTRYKLSTADAATYARLSLAERLAKLDEWAVIRAQINTLMAQSEALLDVWRADTTNRESYKQAMELERQANALTYSI